MTRLETKPSADPAFEESLASVVGELQSALASLVSHLPGSGGRAVDIERGLGLDKKRGWQIYRVATARTPLSEIANIPGAPTMRRVLSAAARRRLPRDVIARTTRAFERFETFADEHGGDRSDLVSLASGLAHAVDNQHELAARKAAFKANAHLWGIRAQVAVRTGVFNIRAGAPGFDLLTVYGDIGLQRLRRAVPLTVHLSTSDARDGITPPVSEAYANPLHVQPRAAQSRGMELMAEYSSKPLPQIEPRVQVDGSLESEVLFPPSGKAGAVTLYGSQFVAGVSAREQPVHGGGSMVRMPCEKLVIEQLVPAGLSNPATVRVAVYGRRDMPDRAMDRRTVDLLPQRETVQYLGRLESVPPLAGVPEHANAVGHALQRRAWRAVAFDVYRCTIDYPLLHSMVLLEVDAVKP